MGPQDRGYEDLGDRALNFSPTPMVRQFGSPRKCLEWVDPRAVALPPAYLAIYSAATAPAMGRLLWFDELVTYCFCTSESELSPKICKDARVNM